MSKDKCMVLGLDSEMPKYAIMSSTKSTYFNVDNFVRKNAHNLFQDVGYYFFNFPGQKLVLISCEN